MESTALVDERWRALPLWMNDGAIIFLDQQKAFDRVEWGRLNECLETFGFGKGFCANVSMLYHSASSCINTNGYLSSFFPISRSIRQGCPIAAYLYIIQAEPLAESVKKDREIKGIEIDNDTELKIAQYADDTQLFY